MKLLPVLSFAWKAQNDVEQRRHWNANRNTRCVILLLIAFGAALTAETPTKPPLDLGTLGIDSFAAAVNGKGQVVGENTLSTDASRHAFSWTPTSGMIDLGTLAGLTSSYAVGVNGNGQVVGNSYTQWGGPVSRSFSWTDTQGMIDLGTLGGTWSEAVAVNDRGQVVGSSTIGVG